MSSQNALCTANARHAKTTLIACVPYMVLVNVRVHVINITGSTMQL